MTSKKVDIDLAIKEMKTIMIAALDRFEREFSYLWGDRRDINDLTDDEYQFREIWEDTRKSILDYGNNRIRSLINDPIQEKPFRVDFKVENRKQRREDNG